MSYKIEKQIAFIGGGHITEILLSNWSKSSLQFSKPFLVCDPNADRIKTLQKKFTVQEVADNIQLVNKGDYVFFNVRPQMIGQVIDELATADILSRNVLITLAAGIPMRVLLGLNKQLTIVRVSPNPASQIGWGFIPIAFNANITEGQKEEINRLFSPLGQTMEVSEEKINAITALSSPASVYLFFQSLIDAGVMVGLEREMATQVAHQTVIGVIETWKHKKIPLSHLMEEACTPGGISVESIQVLETYNFKTAMVEAIQRATQKADQFTRDSESADPVSKKR